MWTFCNPCPAGFLAHKFWAPRAKSVSSARWCTGVATGLTKTFLQNRTKHPGESKSGVWNGASWQGNAAVSHSQEDTQQRLFMCFCEPKRNWYQFVRTRVSNLHLPLTFRKMSARVASCSVPSGFPFLAAANKRAENPVQPPRGSDLGCCLGECTEGAFLRGG